MKHLKTCFGLLLSLLMVAVMLCGCAAPAAPASEAPAAETPAADEPVPQSTPQDISTLKIGAFSNSTINDGGYTQALYTAFESLKQIYALKDEQVILVENVYDGTPDVQNIIQQLITEGCNVIIGHSNGYNEDLDAFAQKYPEVKFYCYEGTTSPLVNTYSVNNQEAIYLLGYLCAKMSKNNELGFIAPMQNAHVIRSVDAFALGAKKANPDATVRLMWVNSWWDPETDKLCAQTLMGEGINSIAYYGSTSAALQACQENGAYCTGFHIDMQDYAPEACLSSFMWNWVPILSEIVDRYVAGDMENRIIIGGMEMGCAELAPINASIVPAEVIADVEAVQKSVMAGETQVFVGPISDNEGNVVLEEGEILTEDQLFSVMYLVDNVIGSLS